MQFFTGISRNTQSTHMLLLTECIWEFQNNALWDTLQHALLVGMVIDNLKSLGSKKDGFDLCYEITTT